MRLFDALRAMRAGEAKPKKKNGMPAVPGEKQDSGRALWKYPRPQLYRENWICLNGRWNYAFTAAGSRPERFDGQIQVPFSPECSRSGVGRRLEPGEYLWYFRTVFFSEIPEGKRLLLHFGAVDERCTVWWNGKQVCAHTNGYLPFSCDVTEYLRTGKNSLWVRVQDDTDQGVQCRGKQTLDPGGMFYTAQSGIWQTVWLEWTPENYVRKLKLTPLYDEGEVRLEITLTQPEDVRVLIRGEWTSYVHQVDRDAFTVMKASVPRAASVPPEGGVSRCALAAVTVALPELHAWSPEDPFLYHLEITAGEDVVSSYFALRKFSVGTDAQGYPRLMLNNRPYFFNGVLDQGYWPESLYTPPDDEAMVFDISQMKALGFNTIRKHLKIEPMRWYYHCDRLGMVVWQDMINGGGKLDLKRLCYLPTALPALTARVKDSHYRFFARNDRRARVQWEEDCMEMIGQLYNCPCIGMWIPFNEGWGQFDALRIGQRIKKLDTTRLVDHASGWFDQGGGDVKSVHNYFRKLKVEKDARPFVLSEYGGCTCAVEGHTAAGTSYGYRTCKSTEEFTAAFLKLQQEIRRLEKKGLAGAVYTQLSDVEEEINGLYTYDRKICKVRRDTG